MPSKKGDQQVADEKVTVVAESAPAPPEPLSEAEMKAQQAAQMKRDAAVRAKFSALLSDYLVAHPDVKATDVPDAAIESLRAEASQ
jgi:hypothetical protein